MDKILDYLKQLELSDEEASIYLTLLQTGPVSVKSLAEEVDIKRTTAYIYINTLINKGLIVKVVKGTQKMVAANDPKECLEDLVKRKIERAEEIKKGFPSILSSITTAMSPVNDISDADVRHYKGINGVMKIYEEALQSKELRSYVNLSEMAGLFPENIDIFQKGFKKNQELQFFEIFEDSPQSRKAIEFQSKNPRFFYKFHPQDMNFSAADTLIYDGKVAIINILNNGASGIILKNSDYYKNSKELFDFFWRMLPEVAL
jgi:sugar-specific transcriptional regulator TrmB